VETESGKIVRGFKSTSKRHGTLNLFAARQVATGHVHSTTTATKTREDFLALMDQVVAETPADKELHVILDNYCTHKRNEDWLAKNPRVHFHFTPTSASWLNQVEIWFGILSRKALRGASFSSIAELRSAIRAFIANYSQNPRPFKWRKREVHGRQLKNTIGNLRNKTLGLSFIRKGFLHGCDIFEPNQTYRFIPNKVNNALGKATGTSQYRLAYPFVFEYPV
jgi:transposase